MIKTETKKQQVADKIKVYRAIIEALTASPISGSLTYHRILTRMEAEKIKAEKELKELGE